MREYLTIKILHNDMTVMVPCENAGKAGLRRVIDEETVKKVLAVLSDDVSEMPKNWNRRFKHNRDKIKTGDIFELAEVVRNLAIREQDKGLSTGEKQMYTRAKKILASEMMYALDKDEEQAEAYLDDILTRTRHAGRYELLRQAQQTMKAVALLVAAGSGERLGASRPKAFVALAGRPMLEWSLDALRGGGDRRGGRGAARGARRRLAGASACAAARRARSPYGWRWRRRVRRDAVVVHDAARPLVTPELFAAALAALADADAAVAAAPR